MTISLAARDPETGAFGMVITSSSPAVAARCIHLRAGVGAVASQNVTNPALGRLALDVLEKGAAAADAVGQATASDAFSAYRQLTAVDAAGTVACFSGDHALGIHAYAEGDQAVAAGNMLHNDEVPGAMLDAYAASTAARFEERLLHGLQGALAAGGEAGSVRSAGLAVVEAAEWRVTDLRVDDHDDPAGELARLLALWLPQKNDYLVRAHDPQV
ncbi:MAG TPA: DUF1028 domain-containing protein, partial [Homoserinimonas sp.]|nr:DUF1028 domain-containing protein [Homoserinimonas sp.]